MTIKKLLRLAGIMAGGCALLVGLFAWRLTAYLDRPTGGRAFSTILVERGSTLKPTLDDLGERGVLSRPRWLYYYARFAGRTEILAGEYEIRATDTPLEILAMLGEGRLKMESFTLPEGYDRWQTRDLLVSERWISAPVFERLCDDQTFLESHQIPGPSCDGYLFPETYTFARGVGAEKIFAEMFATFHQELDEVAKEKGRGPMQLGVRELATLASIVEKETGAGDERGRIACVFYNRLMAKKKWLLNTDPTVIYAAKLEDPNFDGDLKREHLRKLDSPYNTYRNVGLPPGPIANAGRAAFEAVIEPDTCKDFFFVSMNNGRHQFCPTMECHNRAVQKWQIDYFQRRKR